MDLDKMCREAEARIATGIVLACRHGLPVYNLRKPGAREALEHFLSNEES